MLHAGGRKLLEIENGSRKGKKKYGVVGIGNAIVDILASVKEELLLELKLEKGIMKLISEEEISLLHGKIANPKQISGGSAANTIAGLAMLGNNVAFIGKVGDDSLGRSFEKGMSDIGVFYRARRYKGMGSTGCCIVMTTPDAQRTMNTCLGISGALEPSDIDEDIIKDSEIVYLEGYLMDSISARKAFKKAVGLSKKNGGRVALTLSDSFCVERHRKEFMRLLAEDVDILFANEDEIKTLFQVSKFEDAADICSRYNKIFALTRGESGSVVIRGSRKYCTEPEKNIEIVDTTGAGDMYAAGFLHGYINNRKIDICARMGNLAAAAVITHFGARPEVSISDLLNKNIW
jgi:sugar/nucleoside kinase (ribokinase family)